MATLGLWNDLKLIRWAPEGAFLDGAEFGEVFLMLNQVPAGSKPGQMLKVFLYLDAEDCLTASLRAPLAQLGDVALLKVTSVKKTGAFLGWGLPQDLFLPWKEVKRAQKSQVKEGQEILVIVFSDESGRVAASTRLEDFLSDEADEFQEGDKVSLVIGDKTDLGVRVVVNQRYWGMVHASDIFGTLTRGEKREGYIKPLREDRKLNVALHAAGYAKVDTIAQGVLDLLKRSDGFLPITDKSSPKEIYAMLGISKKVFKQSVGALYKNRKIVIEADGIRIL